MFGVTCRRIHNPEDFEDMFYSNRELVFKESGGSLIPVSFRYIDGPHHMTVRFRRNNFPTNTNVSCSCCCQKVSHIRLLLFICFVSYVHVFVWLYAAG